MENIADIISNKSNDSKHNNNNTKNNNDSKTKYLYWIPYTIILFISTLLIYSDIFVNDLLKIIPNAVIDENNLQYKTTAFGSILQGTLLVAIFIIINIIFLQFYN